MGGTEALIAGLAFAQKAVGVVQQANQAKSQAAAQQQAAQSADIARRQAERQRAFEREQQINERDRRVADNNLRVAELQRGLSTADAQRREQLRRTLATRRARFGASGLSSSGGSAQAILNGLISDSDRAGHETAADTRRNIEALRTDSSRVIDDNANAFSFLDDSHALAEKARKQRDDFNRRNQSRSLLSNRLGTARQVVDTFNSGIGFGRSLIA